MKRPRTKDLARIARVVEMSFEADQARMRRLRLSEDELRARLEDLSPARAAPEPGAPIDPATLAGADLRWQRWAEERRREINMSLARLRVEQIQAAEALTKTFGRSQAVAALIRAEEGRRARDE